jgi:hypothetical protein
MFKLHNTPFGQVVQRLADNAFIPKDEQNVDYQEYLKWCSQGNQPEPADE